MRCRKVTRCYTERPNWKDLEAQVGASIAQPSPISIDSVLDPSRPPFSTERPMFFRERHGWCPYSERVWLVLELGKLDYDTVRIDNTGGPRPSYYGGQTPQMRWSDGKMQGESMDLVSELDRRYNLGLRSDDDQVQACVNQFRTVFPRARPSSRAAYLFQYNGEPLWRSVFEQTLEKTDELLASVDGPFFCGHQLTAADIAWAPFLERYRYQLPCLHKGLEPDDATQYPLLAQWFAAMDNVPAFRCRVQGDAASWRKVLSMAGFGNAGAPPVVEANMVARVEREVELARTAASQTSLWQQYSAERPHVADSPQDELARIIVSNREAIVRDAVKQAVRSQHLTNMMDQEPLESALGALATCLLNDSLDVTREAIIMAQFLDERICVPRDMGILPAACLKAFAHRGQ